MKIGVSSYSFSKLVNAGKMEQIEVIASAKKMGFDVIEFSTIKCPEGETALTFAPKLREECDKVGLPVANYTIGADFLNGSGGDWQAEAGRLEDEVRVAKILGAPGMRHDATAGYAPEHTGPRGFDDAVEVLAKGCRQVTKFAADLGIKTMVENHGFFCQDSDRVEKLANAVNHENFGILIDMGNFLCADESPPLALGRLMSCGTHVHAKDFHVKSGDGPNPGEGWFRSRAGNYLRGSVIGHGDVPVIQCLNVMKQHGYDGVLSIEFEGIEDPLRGIQIGHDNLRRFVTEVYGS